MSETQPRYLVQVLEPRHLYDVNGNPRWALLVTTLSTGAQQVAVQPNGDAFDGESFGSQALDMLRIPHTAVCEGMPIVVPNDVFRDAVRTGHL